MAMMIGQGMGMLAVVLGFISFQMRTQRQVLVAQTLTAITFCVHYGLIGAPAGLIMNALCIVRNLAYYHKDKPLFSGAKCPIFFAVLLCVLNTFSWQGYYSLFVVAGGVINTLCMALNDPQKIRKSILVSSPLVLAYDVFVLSVGGIIYESVVIVSSIIGIIRYRKDAAKAA